MKKGACKRKRVHGKEKIGGGWKIKRAERRK